MKHFKTGRSGLLHLQPPCICSQQTIEKLRVYFAPDEASLMAALQPCLSQTAHQTFIKKPFSCTKMFLSWLWLLKWTQDEDNSSRNVSFVFAPQPVSAVLPSSGEILHWKHAFFSVFLHTFNRFYSYSPGNQVSGTNSGQSARWLIYFIIHKWYKYLRTSILLKASVSSWNQMWW